MKSWLMATVAAGMAVVASARTVEFNKNFMAAGAKHRNRIAFNTYSVDPLPLNLLATNEIDEIYSSPVECDYSTTKTNSGSATVMIAIDKCLNASSIALIETWVNTIKGTKLKFTDSTGEHDLTFDTTLVEGQCRARTEKEKHGREIEPPAPAPGPAPGPAPVPLMASDLLADGTNYRLHKNVLPGEVERIAAFAKFGRVLTSTDDWNPETIAVVSFVNNEVAYNYVEQFDQKYKISHTFNFQICEGGESCDGHFENCVFLEESVDLFMYNPFTITHSWSCTGKVADGIPVTIVDAQGQRKCYCTCPAGSKMEYSEAYGGHHCVVNEPEVCPCVWADHPFQYDNIDKLETCLFTAFATTKNLPVPFPTDNYVSDYRTNDKDVTGDLTTGPHIDVSITRLYSDVYEYEVLSQAWAIGNTDPLSDSLPDNEVELLNTIGQGTLDKFRTPTSARGVDAPTHYTWKDYQQHRQDKIDEIEITAYGKYEIAVKATDYLGDAFAATCTGCISIVDKYRPKHHDACPTNFCDNSTTLCHSHAEAATAEFTPANQVKAKQLISDFYTFQSTSFNDACEVEDRCDDESFKVKKFFESADTNGDYDVDGSKCFDTDQMTADFLKDDFAKTNPLVPSSGPSTCHQHDVPVPAYQCTRCCDYSVALKEWWIDYTCGHDYDIARCDGDSEEHCETRQCLVLFGDTLATVTANIKGDVKDESDRVLAGIVNEGFQSVTQVHRALQCTKFGGNDGVCNYEASISDLIDVHVTNNFGSADDQYVFWRYKIKGDPAGWRLYNPADLEQFKYTFTDAQTKIILEAWTVCGISRKFYFYVHLHVHSEIKVCDFFAQMWYQTSVSHKSIATTGLEANSLLSFPGSDFAELTFDYQANIGLQYSKNDLRMHVSGVSCSLEFIDPVITKAPVEFLNIQGDSPDIIDRFAVELQEFPHTTTTTKFTITCTFTYTRYDGSTFSTPCSRSFEVDDSTGPYIDPPGGECQWDACAGQGKPGPGEACGGKIVKSHGTAAYVDDFTNDEAECCEGCGVPSQCVSIFDLDTIPNPIKRCVPPAKDGEYGAYGQESYGEYYSGTVELMAQTVANHPTAAAATALLAASAMVAVVALVVVRRRRAADKQAVLEDAYYPLLH